MTGTDLYRNRDFIPDFDALMAEIEARSCALAGETRMRRDLRYGPGPRQRVDLVFPPGEPADAPLHVFVHGGYWRSGSKEAHRLVAAPVLAAGGIAAIVGYELMPETRLGAIVGQVRAAVRHVAAIAPELGADPARFSVSGHSAGAHLVALLAARAPGDRMPPELPALRALLLVSGIYDLTGIPGSFLKDEARMRADEAADWSPATSRHMPGPIRVITRGALETAPFQDQAAALGADLRAEGQAVELRSEASRNHLSILLDLADPDAPLGCRLVGVVADS
ncbi:alpha/beta hydrolase [uncultured Jannaschia sp.]|uniref:alpha/beta hydrolase n=1 Tax=uncultured Jannaschia sp. TaxID=293347 RepID=UPI00262FDB9C|nr:alpha/beta hydrolase [uncultured Jannaschia sp.]